MNASPATFRGRDDRADAARRFFCAPGPGKPAAWSRRRAFSLVELLVVIGVIVLILAIGIPAFSSMNEQAQRTQARQAIDSALQRAHVLSVSQRSMAAVRFAPAYWEQSVDSEGGSGASPAEAAVAAGPQTITVYQHTFTSLSPTPAHVSGAGGSGPSDGSFVQFNERFERVDDLPPATLPGKLWAAPAESLLDTPDFDGEALLTGTPGRFVIDAAQRNVDFLHADDFLVVFDPRAGVMTARWPSSWASGPVDRRRSSWQLYAYDAGAANEEQRYEKAWETTSSGAPRLDRPFRRFNFTGVVLYDRERFLAVDNGDPADRQAFLEDRGELYYVNRRGGNLIAAGGQP